MLSPEALASYYGVAGINYDIPMVRHMGRRYRVLAATRYQDVANDFMKRMPGAAVLVVFDNGLIIMSDRADLGEPVTEWGAS